MYDLVITNDERFSNKIVAEGRYEHLLNNYNLGGTTIVNMHLLEDGEIIRCLNDDIMKNSAKILKEMLNK